MNFVLGGRPPPIANIKKILPRKPRAVLAHLRMEHLGLMPSGPAFTVPYPIVCLACGQGSHDTLHISYCPASPTSLCPRYLWTHPVDVAQSLGLDLAEPRVQILYEKGCFK